MLLSIIIPAYNVEKYIPSTLKSLMNQTKKDFEIIVVDDGSTDKTYKTAFNILFKQWPDKFKVIKKTNSGVSSARNEGLKKATGKYVVFLDGDDYVHNSLVEFLFEQIENYIPDVILWGINKVDENRNLIESYFEKYNCKAREMSGIEALNSIIVMKNIWVGTGSIAMKKDLIIDNNLHYIDGCVNGEDQEFHYKAISVAQKVVFINMALTYYVQRIGSISNSYDIKRFDVIIAMKRTAEYLRKKSNAEFNEIATKVENDLIINNFLYNLQSCYANSTRKSIKAILYDISRFYPTLLEEVIGIMKNYKGDSKTLLIQVKIFLLSPTILLVIMNLKNRIKYKEWR